MHPRGQLGLRMTSMCTSPGPPSRRRRLWQRGWALAGG